jgi:O-antigen/teichoic acid export membrane protein
VNLLFSKIEKLISHSLARNTGWMIFGLGANALFRAGVLLLLARLLGVNEYGVFAGAFALVSTVAPYSSLGSQMIFMRYVSTDRDMASTYWGNMIAVMAGSTVILIAALSFVSRVLLGPGTAALVAILVVSNCFMSQLANCASNVFQTFEDLRHTAWLTAFANLMLLLLVAGLAFSIHRATPVQCALAFFGAYTVSACVALAWVHRYVGRIKISLSLLFRRFWEGIGFSLAGSTQAVYNDVDKLMLSHYGMNTVDGFYTFAYRIVDFSTIPVNSIDAACLPRYFALSSQGLSSVVRLAKRIVPFAALSGLLAAVVMLLGSPFVIRLVGHGFANALHVLRWLCVLPVLRGVHQLTGGVLTATGLQNYRTAAQFAVAALNVAMNLMLIPSHGWRGAAWASVASDGALAILNALLVVFAVWRSKRPSHVFALEEH